MHRGIMLLEVAMKVIAYILKVSPLCALGAKQQINAMATPYAMVSAPGCKREVFWACRVVSCRSQRHSMGCAVVLRGDRPRDRLDRKD
jgi:hypothetical protein